MDLRLLTWAEFNAWCKVTERNESRCRETDLHDRFLAARGDIEKINDRLSDLHGR